MLLKSAPGLSCLGPALLCPSLSTVEDGFRVLGCGARVSTSCLCGSDWACVKVFSALQQGSAAALLAWCLSPALAVTKTC